MLVTRTWVSAPFPQSCFGHCQCTNRGNSSFLVYYLIGSGPAEALSNPLWWNVNLISIPAVLHFTRFFCIFTSLSTDCLVCFSFCSHFLLKLWTPYTCSFVIVNWIEGLLPFFLLSSHSMPFSRWRVSFVSLPSLVKMMKMEWHKKKSDFHLARLIVSIDFPWPNLNDTSSRSSQVVDRMR